MGEFAATLQDRLREAHASLRAALAAGDADLTDTQLDEIDAPEADRRGARHPRTRPRLTSAFPDPR